MSVTIVDDNQWEPDEEFFLKLALVPKVSYHPSSGVISYHNIITDTMYHIIYHIELYLIAPCRPHHMTHQPLHPTVTRILPCTLKTVTMGGLSSSAGPASWR